MTAAKRGARAEEIRVYVGFCSGCPADEPLKYQYPKTRGTCVAVFRKKGDARAMYEDVREYRLVPKPRARRAGRGGR